MLHWKIEGERLRQGLSVYHPRDKSSAGFYLRLGNHAWRVRYSKITKQWYRDYNKVDPTAMQDWYQRHGGNK